MPLITITLIAGLLRFLQLSHLPVSLNWDEVSHGYNAFSILLTGRDEWGQVFPLIFRAFGDYKLPVYIYLTTIPVWLFGLNAFAVRFISALAGTLAIPGIYLLVKELFPSRKIVINFPKPITLSYEILAALVLALLPWHIFISRPALEANLSLTFIIFGFYFLLRFINSKSSLLPSVILLGLSLHTYNTARVFVPLLVIATFLAYRPKLRFSARNILAITIALILGGLVVYQVYVGEGTARYQKLEILSPAAVFRLGEERANSHLPGIVAKAVYNRPVFFITTLAKNYFGYFSPSFFSQTWGAQYQFAIPGKNLLTLPVFLLAFLGFFSYLSMLRTDKSYRFLYAWLFLAPIAASLTIDPPQALRPNPMIPAIVIFSILGLNRLLLIIPEEWKHRLLAGILVWILIILGLYLQNYRTDYRLRYSSSWQYGYEQVMKYVQNHHSDYENIFITKRFGEPHIFYAFYTKLSPQELQPGHDNIRFKKSDWYWTDKIGNVYFVNDWQIPSTSVSTLPLESGGNISTQRSLLITSYDHLPVNAHVIEHINFLDGSPAFTITSIP